MRWITLKVPLLWCRHEWKGVHELPIGPWFRRKCVKCERHQWVNLETLKKHYELDPTMTMKVDDKPMTIEEIDDMLLEQITDHFADKLGQAFVDQHNKGGKS